MAYTYTVRRGDNLTRIAERLGTTVDELVRLNNIRNPDLIFPDQELITEQGHGPPESTPLPRDNPSRNPASSAPSAPAPPPAQPATQAMVDVGMNSGMGSYNPRAPMNYQPQIGTVQPASITAPQPGSLTTGGLTPIPGSGPAPENPWLANSRALETALTEQQATESQRTAAVDQRWQQRATAAEANRAAADEEAANAAYGVRSPVAAAMTAAAPDPATRTEATRAAGDEMAANASAGLRFDNASVRDLSRVRLNPTPMTPAERARWLARSEQLAQPAPAPAGDLGEFENMTREQLLAIDPATLTREQWQRYDAALSRLLAMPGV